MVKSRYTRRGGANNSGKTRNQKIQNLINDGISANNAEAAIAQDEKRQEAGRAVFGNTGFNQVIENEEEFTKNLTVSDIQNYRTKLDELFANGSVDQETYDGFKEMLDEIESEMGVTVG